MRAGVIIAGGRSTRFGSEDKALATIAGRPMIRHVADRLGSVIDVLVVNGRREQRDPIHDALDGLEVPMRYAPDEIPDRGPLAGIERGLAAVPDEVQYAAVVACDMPYLDPAVLRYLFDRATGTDAAVPRFIDGWYHPTHAVYRVHAMREACRDALAGDDHRIMTALDELSIEVITEDEIRRVGRVESIENVNTPHDYREAERRLR